MAIFTDHVEFGSRFYGTATAKRIYFTVGNVVAVAITTGYVFQHWPVGVSLAR